jgi:hypothetical protein
MMMGVMDENSGNYWNNLFFSKFFEFKFSEFEVLNLANV